MVQYLNREKVITHCNFPSCPSRGRRTAAQRFGEENYAFGIINAHPHTRSRGEPNGKKMVVMGHNVPLGQVSGLGTLGIAGRQAGKGVVGETVRVQMSVVSRVLRG